MNAEQDIVIGDCLTRDQAEDIINVLVKEADLQDLLVDAQFRSDQHRRNYATLKAQHEKILHQVKIMETEIIKLENEKKDMEIEISGLVDQAVDEKVDINQADPHSNTIHVAHNNPKNRWDFHNSFFQMFT